MECCLCDRQHPERQQITSTCGHPYHLQCFVIFQYAFFDNNQPFECSVCDADLSLLSVEALEEHFGDDNTDNVSENTTEPPSESSTTSNMTPLDKFNHLRKTSKDFREGLKDIRKLKAELKVATKEFNRILKEKSNVYKATARPLLQLFKQRKKECKKQITSTLEYKRMKQTRRNLFSKIYALSKTHKFSNDRFMYSYLKIPNFYRSYSRSIDRRLRLVYGL